MSRYFKKLLLAIGALSALTIAASAYALATKQAAPDPLAGIGISTTSFQDGANATGVDQHTAAAISDIQVGPDQLVAEARTLTATVDGHTVYLVPTSSGSFCVYVAQIGENCFRPLSNARPATFAVFDRDGPGGTPPIVFGIAQDDVSSISFLDSGTPESVAVHNNVFVTDGNASSGAEDITAPTATLADGQTVSLS